MLHGLIARGLEGAAEIVSRPVVDVGAVLELVDRVLVDVARVGDLPQRLFIALDNAVAAARQLAGVGAGVVVDVESLAGRRRAGLLELLKPSPVLRRRSCFA